MIETCVTSEMDKLLTKPYTAKEIVNALTQMHPLKSSGPDGMPVFFFFYHKCWDFIQPDLIPILLDILNNGANPRAINYTPICLIPKKKK